MSATAAPAYVSVPAAARRLGLSADRFRRLVKEGRVTALQLPGCHPAIPATELDRIVREFTIPARAE